MQNTTHYPGPIKNIGLDNVTEIYGYDRAGFPRAIFSPIPIDDIPMKIRGEITGLCDQALDFSTHILNVVEESPFRQGLLIMLHSVFTSAADSLLSAHLNRMLEGAAETTDHADPGGPTAPPATKPADPRQSIAERKAEVAEARKARRRVPDEERGPAGASRIGQGVTRPGTGPSHRPTDRDGNVIQ